MLDALAPTSVGRVEVIGSDGVVEVVAVVSIPDGVEELLSVFDGFGLV